MINMIESIRDAKLIEEQLVYEENFFESAQVEIEKSNEISYQIRDYDSKFMDYDIIFYDDDFPELDCEHYSYMDFKEALRIKMMEYDERLDQCMEDFEPQFEAEMVDNHFDEYEGLIEEYDSIVELNYHAIDDYSFDREELQFEENLNRLVEDEPICNNTFIEMSFLEIEKSEEFDYQINSYDVEQLDIPEYELIDDFFDYDLDDDYCFEEIDMDAAYYGCELRGYVVDDDPFESLDEICYFDY